MIQKSEVIIVGGGPIGLLLGNLLAANQIPVIILEKDLKRTTGSKAIGVTPVSLAILDKIQLAETFIAQGVPVHAVHVLGSRHKLGQVRLDELPPPYSFILALPQEQTEWLLEENLKKFPCVSLKRGRHVFKIADYQDRGEVTARVYTAPGKASGQEETYAGRFICGCDGLHSTIRQLLQIPFKGKYYSETFVMGNYHAADEHDKDAYLFFTRRGSVESFPLPGGRRRWIAQTPHLLKEDLETYLETEVAIRTGVRLDPGTRISTSPFQPQRFLAAAFFKSAFILCGDAAHTMSPIGGQGMNTGFGDADWLAFIIEHSRQINAPGALQKELAHYEMMRKRAVWVTANRAWTSMRVGTLRGYLTSGFRNLLITGLLQLPVASQLPILFAGHSVPYRRVGIA